MSYLSSFTLVYRLTLWTTLLFLPSLGLWSVLNLTDLQEKFILCSVHEIAISLACIISGLVGLVAYRCYQKSGTVTLKYWSLAFIGFAIIYFLHGLFTRTAPLNPIIFLIFGPVSRIVLSAYLLIGITKLNTPPDPISKRYKASQWKSHIVLFIEITGLLIFLVFSPIPLSVVYIKTLERISLIILIFVFLRMLPLIPIRSPLLLCHFFAISFFIQASIAFLMSMPWNITWWYAHLCSGVGFLILGYGIVQAYENTENPDQIYDVGELREKLLQSEKKQNEMAFIIEQKEQAELELKQTLTELQQTQIQLVQSEKMSALGSLVAGVAHEINNPVSFISSNLVNCEVYVKDLVHHLQLYQEAYPQPEEEIIENAECIEIDYLIEDFPRLIDSMKEGTNRLCEISKSLRTFSRSDLSKVAFNVHEGLDSTLMILRHRLKANSQRPEIEVVKEYGNIPQVMCYPGQVNQVFMNLISNAIDAIDEASENISFETLKKNPKKIILKTEVDYDCHHVKILIQDDGIGMSPEVSDRVFDHLFTTKPVGKGTGLGLSISRQIIEEKHNGKVKFASESGVGSCFTLELPLTKVLAA